MATSRPEPALSGLQREQQDLNARLYGRRRDGDPGHGHGHGSDHEHHDGCCGGGTGNPYIDEAEGFVDPGLAQCCIQELEDNRKWAELDKSLRRVDPVARAEREALEVVNVVAPAQTTSVREWLAACRDRFAQPPARSSEADAGDADANDSDAELDGLLAEMEDDEVLERFARVRLQEQRSREAKSVSMITTEDALAAWLLDASAEPGAGGPRANLILVVPHSSAQTSRSHDHYELTQSAQDALLRVVHAHAALAAASISADLLGPSHPLRVAAASLNGGRLRDDQDLPCVLALSNANFAPLAALPRAKLAQDAGAVESLAQWLVVTIGSGASSSRAGNGDNSDDEDASFCDRPGCSRRFPHEHVKRDMKQGVDEYVDCDDIHGHSH